MLEKAAQDDEDAEAENVLAGAAPDRTEKGRIFEDPALLGFRPSTPEKGVTLGMQ